MKDRHRRYRFLIVSDYAGEQGHVGGGHKLDHGSFTTAEEAFAELDRLEREHYLDYRFAWVQVRREAVE